MTKKDWNAPNTILFYFFVNQGNISLIPRSFFRSFNLYKNSYLVNI
jgi:hypothetical protein